MAKRRRQAKDAILVNKPMRQYIDQDYRHLLSKEEAAFLDKFNKEYYNHTFSKDPIHKNVDKAYKEATDRENAARRDIMNVKLRGSMPTEHNELEAQEEIADMAKLNRDADGEEQ
jgi:hypothetical protein